MDARELIVLEECPVLDEATFTASLELLNRQVIARDERARLLAEERASWNVLKTLHQVLAA